MTENTPEDTAEIQSPRRWRISPVWLVPLLAALIGLWLLYDNFASQGPTVTLEIDSASGIKANKTKLEVRSVEIGHVTKVTLTKDYHGALVTVQMKAGTAKLLGEDAKFWVVKPRVGPKGVSGLNTLLSGAYLEMYPAKTPGGKRKYKILSSPPHIPSSKPGITLKLTNKYNNTLSVGDPIVYQGQDVGQIEDSQFSVDKRMTVYTIFIKKPYSKLITRSTQFWLRSGLDMHLGTGGLDVQLGSLQSMLIGGITFGEPEGIESGKPAQKNERFKLYATHKDAIEDRYQRKIRYVILLDDSVRGLSAGAPVSYRGLRIGTVEKVPYYPKNFSLKGLSGFKIPVLIAIEPERPSLGWANWSNKQWREKNRQFFEHGLRATIKSANLLTGAMFISLTFDHHAKGYKPKKVGGYPVFPSEPSQFANIQQQISKLMDKLDHVDFTSIMDQVKDTAKTADDTLKQLHDATKQLNRLLSDPATRQLPAQLSKTLQELQNTLGNFQQGGQGYQKLKSTIDKLNQTLDNTAPVMRTLRDHPNALIFGAPQGQDPVPRAKP